MQIFDDLENVKLGRDAVVAIGAFDGVHRGHQHLVKRMRAEALRSDRLTVVLTFHPHPSAVLSPDNPPKYLTTPGRKAVLLEQLGVDVLVILPIDWRLATTPAYEFVRQIQPPLRMSELWVGADFALGRDRAGGVPQLRQWGEDLGYRVQVVPPYVWEGEIISSTRIRQLIFDGKVDEAARLLNRYHGVAGEVVHGAGRGRRFGVPTANLRVHHSRAVPANGIYAVFVVLGEERFQGVANLGRRPSFDNGEYTIEVHILDFDRDIYGCDVVVEFVRWLRPERRFESAVELYNQIDEDIRQARDILAQEALQPHLLSFEPGQPLRACGCSRARFEELSYTADVGIRAYGCDLRDLFVNAAYGMFSLISDLDGLFHTTQHEVEIDSLDRESLLVDWLGELLYIHDTTSEILIDFDIEELTDTHLKGRAYGTHLAKPGLQIKAVTYHDLEIKEAEAGYSATVVFDI